LQIFGKNWRKCGFLGKNYGLGVKNTRLCGLYANYAKGKLTQVKSSVSETRYKQFDELGRLLQMEQRTPVSGETMADVVPRVSNYEYNFAGALVKETYPSGREVKNEFEADGDLSRIYGKASTPNAIERTYANGFSYTADGKIQRLKLGNNRWESAKFNDRLQVTELALGTSDGDGSLWKLKYDYGELQSNGVDVDTAKNTGNIAKQTLTVATCNYKSVNLQSSVF